MVTTTLTLTTTTLLHEPTPKYLLWYKYHKTKLTLCTSPNLNPRLFTLQFNGFHALLHFLPLPQTHPPFLSFRRVQARWRSGDRLRKGSEEPQNGNIPRLQSWFCRRLPRPRRRRLSPPSWSTGAPNFTFLLAVLDRFLYKHLYEREKNELSFCHELKLTYAPNQFCKTLSSSLSSPMSSINCVSSGDIRLVGRLRMKRKVAGWIPW